jgi:hypothetical protein
MRGEPPEIGTIPLFDSAAVELVVPELNSVVVVEGVVVQISLLLIVVYSHRCWKHACLVFQPAANPALGVVRFCFQNPIDRLNHLFPISLLLPVVGLAVRGLVHSSSRIGWVVEAVVLLDLLVANLVVVVVSLYNMRVERGRCVSHLRCHHRLQRILIGGGGCCICCLWR